LQNNFFNKGSTVFFLTSRQAEIVAFSYLLVY